MPSFVSPELLRQANALASWYRGRPSDYLDIHDPWIAWCVDSAAAHVAAYDQRKALDEAKRTSGTRSPTSDGWASLPKVPEPK